MTPHLFFRGKARDLLEFVRQDISGGIHIGTPDASDELLCFVALDAKKEDAT